MQHQRRRIRCRPHGWQIEAPVVLGEYRTSPFGNGPVSVPRHVWTAAESAEVASHSMIGRGGITGAGSGGDNLWTFRVMRTASHFERKGFLDSVNAHDNSGISLGPCHGTLVRTQVNIPAEPREIGRCFPMPKPITARGWTPPVSAAGRCSMAASRVRKNSTNLALARWMQTTPRSHFPSQQADPATRSATPRRRIFPSTPSSTAVSRSDDRRDVRPGFRR